MNITARLLFIPLAALAMSAGAQTTPNANYTDMWWNPSESGWGISFMQHASTNKAFATWYTFDARQRDPSTFQFKPLWIVMSNGQWTSPNTITGRAYVLNGVPYNGSGTNRRINDVGTFSFTFTDLSNGTFTFDIAPPPNAAPDDPAFGLPAMSGTRAITRYPF